MAVILSEPLTAIKPFVPRRVSPSYNTASRAGDRMLAMKIKDIVRQDAIARRLRAIRNEMGIKPPELAKRLGINRSRYINWETFGPSGNMPAEEYMAALCDLLPGLTMDYIYRGNLDAVPHALAIRLTAHEAEIDPDQPEDPAS